MIRLGVDEMRSAISLPVADWIAKKAGPNVGKVIRPVVMPEVAMRAAVVRQGGTRSEKDQDTKTGRQRLFHISLDLALSARAITTAHSDT
jgi:hypothetical protein